VEKRSQVTPLRLEKLAKERLQMRTVTPAITNYVTYKADEARPPQGAQ
jgi:cell division protein FtsL